MQCLYLLCPTIDFQVIRDAGNDDMACGGGFIKASFVLADTSKIDLKTILTICGHEEAAL